jgi:hypothetical protein
MTTKTESGKALFLSFKRVLVAPAFSSVRKDLDREAPNVKDFVGLLFGL